MHVSSHSASCLVLPFIDGVTPILTPQMYDHVHVVPVLQVPSFGILTSGTRYIFYKYVADDKRLIKCTPLHLHLQRGTTAKDAADQALPVLKHLVYIINKQKESLAIFNKQK